MGEDIGFSETERAVNSLFSLFRKYLNLRELDSPLFHHIKGMEPYVLPPEEYTQIIQELADKEHSIFALVEKARIEMENENFSEACKSWKKASEKVENDVYFTQQLALCTYKDKTVDPNIALIDALRIIGKLEPDNRNTTIRS